MSSKAPLAGWVDPNFPNPNGPADAPIIIYGYTPSLAVALLGVILFSISAILHAFQLFRYRTWWFTPVLVGTVMEIVGYVFRILSAKIDPYHVIYFVVQYFFIVVAPVFFSAGIYTILSVLINRLGHQFTPVSPRLILLIFIISDVVSTGVQIAGAALIGKAESNRQDPTTPNNILLAGLAFQVFTFFIFLILTSIFLWKSRHATGVREKHNSPRGVKKSFLVAFVVATLAVYLRTCFRLAETAQGLYGYLSVHETFFGCLEFAPIVVAVVLLNIWHPGRCIPQY
ncbi:RTA1 like protein [Tothia fuscella]|uniref:RTA1 like protein n=1 Tax=Tothia fuscella TaxID=1048955 RepID=A0A9P4NKD9_9PEZI|nr:RTA1 like protein [Tothia fuscella]